MSIEDEEHRVSPPLTDKPSSGERLLQLMFSGMSHPDALPATRRARVADAPYQPLHQLKSTLHASYQLPHAQPVVAVGPDSPAIDVMTDLSKVAAITTRRLATIEEANRTMRARGVRALFVLDDARSVLGIITSTDVIGEKPVQITRERGIRHDEVLVEDVMTPADRLEAIELADVLEARVGDVIATLRLAGRQHALVIEPHAGGGAHRAVRGIFSLTQIARQLGLPPQPVHDIGRTLLEIEAAMRS
ncbi:MAG TPA: CBS domain-containing protein [Casimicrobiaceae bacterium]|nr:CBS domain-containing protein [Casimicrobiaceae bacterium]